MVNNQVGASVLELRSDCSALWRSTASRKDEIGGASSWGLAHLYMYRMRYPAAEDSAKRGFSHLVMCKPLILNLKTISSDGVEWCVSASNHDCIVSQPPSLRICPQHATSQGAWRQWAQYESERSRDKGLDFLEISSQTVFREMFFNFKYNQLSLTSSVNIPIITTSLIVHWVFL